MSLPSEMATLVGRTFAKSNVNVIKSVVVTNLTLVLVSVFTVMGCHIPAGVPSGWKLFQHKLLPVKPIKFAVVSPVTILRKLCLVHAI